MASNQKPKPEKARGATNSGRPNRKAWKKGSIRNGVPGAKFDENGVQLDSKSGIPKKVKRVRDRAFRIAFPEKEKRTYADVVADYNERLEKNS